MRIEQQLVPGRACGSCNVCCVALTIDDPALRKAQGLRCRNALPDNGCAIYASRPETCRTFYCGWRLLRWLPEALRPDQTKVLVQLLEEPDQAGRMGYSVVFTMLTPAGLAADGLAESVAAAIRAKIPTYLTIPGPPGFTSSQGKINEVFEDAVHAKDKPRLLRLLREAYAKGKKGPRARIVLT